MSVTYLDALGYWRFMEPACKHANVTTAHAPLIDAWVIACGECGKVRQATGEELCQFAREKGEKAVLHVGWQDPSSPPASNCRCARCGGPALMLLTTVECPMCGRFGA